jgi:hypothetical protein
MNSKVAHQLTRKNRRRRALQVETLEARLNLSTLIDGGINVTGNDDWSTFAAWVNVGNAFRRWGNVDRPWEADGALTYTDQGIPMQDAGSISFLRDYGGGTYKLRYEGTGDVTFSHRGSLAPGTLQTVAGVTTADVNVFDVPFGDNNELIYLHLRNVDPNDTVRDLRLVAPEFDVDTTQVFQDEFVDRLAPFSTLRLMDWNRTNNSQVTSWTERRGGEEFIQAGGHSQKGGVAWEHMIELANTTRNDAWINVPHRVAADATANGVNDPDNTGDEYIRESARLWRDQLDPSLKVIVEYSNEPWNCQFQQCQGGQHDYYSIIAPRLAEISRIFHQEFQGQDDRLEVVLAGQNANSFHVRRRLEYFSNTGQSERLDAISTAPYFRESSSVTYTDLDSLFADISHPEAGVLSHAGLAADYGVDFYAYEGGQHLVPGNTSIELMQQAQNDPRMAVEYARMLDIWSEAGGDMFAFYSFVSLGGQHGFWGMLDEIETPGSQKWDAVMRSMLPAGDATLDHLVTYDDFSLLRDNYGSGQWWEQGDTDGDNDIDADDFVSMFHNIDLAALTSLQCDEIYAFAAAQNITIPTKDAATVTISATDEFAVEESGDVGVFTLSRDQTNGALDVTYTIGGSADANDIIEQLTGIITFADGQATATLTITPFDDAGHQLDGNEDGTGGDSYLYTGNNDNGFYRLGDHFPGSVRRAPPERTPPWVAKHDNSSAELSVLVFNGGIRGRNNAGRKVSVAASQRCGLREP